MSVTPPLYPQMVLKKNKKRCGGGRGKQVEGQPFKALSAPKLKKQAE
jgi:hypothetical protein